MLVEEHEARVLYRSEYNPYFKINEKLFPALEFLVQLLQHLPEPRAHLVRLAPEGRYSGPPQGWKQQHSQRCTLHIGGASEDCTDQSVSGRQSRAAPRTAAVSQETARVWARLLAKIYEVDALRCNRCGSPMKVLALITDPQQCLRILLHLIKTGAAPPGLDASTLS
jgi:hypothetical protein